METTGLAQGIVIDGGPGPPKAFPDVTIMFSDSSDRDALKSLESLDTRLLLPNANGEGIVVVGVLAPTVRHTSTGPGRSASEPYQEFCLSRWYLRAPFVRYLRIQTPLDETSGVEHDEQLRPEDFGSQIGGDLARFIRPR